MNKMTKAAVAGAAGIALLLGGAGSLALWNSTASTGFTTINSGELSITATPGMVAAPTLWVPGDSGTYKTSITIVATGDNMKATLEVDDSSVVGPDAVLLDDLDIDLAFDAAPLPAGITDNNDGTFEVLAGTYTALAVTVTVTFTDPGTIDNTNQSKAVNLSNLKLLLTQIPLP